MPIGQTLKCRIIDFSRSGARLSVASTFALPNMFELRVVGRTYQVWVVRRAPDHIGVQFI
jgi:hypothetical protein